MEFNLSDKKILIIDDFYEFRVSFKRMLDSYNARNINEVTSGEEAIQLLKRKSYDIIFCDYYLGQGKDGQQVLEEVKHNNIISNSTIFIIITVEAQLSFVMGAIEYKPDDYMIKPISTMTLERHLEKLIALKSTMESIDRAIEQENYRDAISLCKKSIENNPKNPYDFLRIIGDLYIKLSEYENARATYESVLNKHDLPWAQLGLGKVYYFRDDFLKAKDVFQDIIHENYLFVEAYDWLAKTLEELGDLEEAQEIVASAINKSPRAILRQKTLADISYKNHDYDTAEKAFKEVITIGKHSCYKNSSDYTGFAKVLSENNSLEESIKVLEEMPSEFNNDADVRLQSLTTQGIIYKKNNKEEESKKAIEKATELYQDSSLDISTDTSLDLAKTCFELQEKDMATNLLQDIARNNHDDETIINEVQDVFTNGEMEEEGKDILASTKQELVRLNNHGVHLLKEGKLTEAIDHFQEAAEGLPGNKIININTAQALITYMQKEGKTDEFLRLSAKYLDRVKKIDSSYKKYQDLHRSYLDLMEPTVI